MGGAQLASAVVVALAALLGLWNPAPPPAGDVRFEGNAAFSSGQLLAILRNRYHVPLEGNFGATDADDAAYFLRTFYFSRGYRDASVAYTYRSTRPPSLLFQVDEGPQKSIHRVTFEGATDLPAEHLPEIFNATVRQATLRPFGPMRYVASAVEAGRLALVNALAQRGYLVATAEVLDVPAARPGTVDLIIRIDQGVRYFVRDVSFDLPPPGPRPADGQPSPLDAETLRGVLGAYLDQPYQRNQEALMRTRLEDWLRNRGYLEAEVTTRAALDAATGDVRVAFDVQPGRSYRIGRVRVEGAAFTSAAAILARLGLQSGSPYDASEVDAAARRLWFSGAFSDAEVKPTPRADGTVDLAVQVAETSAKRVQFGLGYSQWEGGFAEVHSIDRNFFGSLNRFSVDAAVSQRSYGVSAAFTDPWILGTDLEGTVALAYGRRELPAYRSTEAGGTVTFARNFHATNLTGYRFQYGYKNVTDSEIFGDDDAENIDPNYTLGTITFSQTYDTRNNILSPMKGLYLNHEVELANPALLGDVAFVRLSAQATYYVPLRPITTERPFVPFLTFNHRAGLLLPYGGTTVVPVQERFFLGGPNTVRSFQLDGLGPQGRDGDPLGGLGMLLFNAELQWPAYNNIYLAAFADAGNVWSEPREIRPADLQLGVGPGLRVYTPLGAVRIDYGYNVNRRPSDPIGAWQVGFGFTF